MKTNIPQKENEELVIVEADTRIHPRTMMIELPEINEIFSLYLSLHFTYRTHCEQMEQ